MVHGGGALLLFVAQMRQEFDLHSCIGKHQLHGSPGKEMPRSRLRKSGLVCQARHKKWDTLDYIGYMAMAWHISLSFNLVFI
jgi:hypothetical protein